MAANERRATRKGVETKGSSRGRSDSNNAAERARDGRKERLTAAGIGRWSWKREWWGRIYAAGLHSGPMGECERRAEQENGNQRDKSEGGGQ